MELRFKISNWNILTIESFVAQRNELLTFQNHITYLLSNALSKFASVHQRIFTNHESYTGPFGSFSFFFTSTITIGTYSPNDLKTYLEAALLVTCSLDTEIPRCSKTFIVKHINLKPR